MLFLETDLAVYKRLVGAPLDSKGRPQLDGSGVPVNREVIGPPDMNSDGSPPVLPSYGIRIPTMVPPFKGKTGLTSRDPDAIRAFAKGFDGSTFRQIPVFDMNTVGRKIDDIWPCVTFRIHNMRFDPEVFIFHDPIKVADTTTAPVTIQNQWGDTIATGFQGNTVRRTPDSFVPLYAITAHAKSNIEAQLILGQILYLFPPKGAITITLQDGTLHTCDMMLQRIVNIHGDDESFQLSLEADEERPHEWAVLYEVETYLDNSTNQFGVQDIRKYPVIYQRILDIENLQGVLSEQPFDLNQREDPET